jgi:hypothetical protein
MMYHEHVNARLRSQSSSGLQCPLNCLGHKVGVEQLLEGQVRKKLRKFDAEVMSLELYAKARHVAAAKFPNWQSNCALSAREAHEAMLRVSLE